MSRRAAPKANSPAVRSTEGMSASRLPIVSRVLHSQRMSIYLGRCGVFA